MIILLLSAFCCCVMCSGVVLLMVAVETKAETKEWETGAPTVREIGFGKPEKLREGLVLEEN